MFRVRAVSRSVTALLLGFVACALLGAGPAIPGLAQELGPQIRVQLKAVDSTQLSSQLTAVIEDLAVQDGERFSEGDVLVTFDCALAEAQLSRARAEYSAKQEVAEVTASLYELQSRSALELSMARAEAQAAWAQVAVYQVMVGRCEIIAPFSGVAGEILVRERQFVAEGEALLDIYDDSGFELEFLAPSAWLSWLEPGYAFSVRIDETGGDYLAEVVRLGGAIDPVSQSIKVYARLNGEQGQEQGLVPGMSGVALITVPQ